MDYRIGQTVATIYGDFRITYIRNTSGQTIVETTGGDFLLSEIEPI